MTPRHIIVFALGLLVAGPLGCGDDETGALPATLSDGTRVGVDQGSLCAEAFCVEGVACKSTYHVQAGGSGDGTANAPFGKLADAAAKAVAGDCIALAPGSYERAVLAGGVSLLGAGAERTTIQTTAGQTGLFIEDGSGGTLRGFAITGPGYGIAVKKVTGLTLTQLRFQGQRPTAIDVRQSTGLKISRVEVLQTAPGTGGGSVGLLLGEGSSATVELAYFSDCGGQGILVHESRLDMTASLVEKSGRYGVVIQCSQNVACANALASSLDRVELDQSAGVGLLVIGAKLQAQRLKVGHTTLSNNIGRGVELQNDAAVELSSSHIHDSGSQGIVVMAATGKLQDTTVEQSGAHGIWIQNIANGTLALSNTKVIGSVGAGIALTQSSGVSITGGSLSGVKNMMDLSTPNFDLIGDGLQIMDNSEATVQGVTISGVERVGLLIDSAKAKVQDSVISGAVGTLLVQKSPIVGSDYSNNKDGQGNSLTPASPTSPLPVNPIPLVGTMPVPLP